MRQSSKYFGYVALLGMSIIVTSGVPAWSRGTDFSALSDQAGNSQPGSQLQDRAAAQGKSKDKKASKHSGKAKSPAQPSAADERASKKNLAPPPPPDPADEAKTYTLQPMPPVSPVGEYSGDVRNLPQVPARETVEPELMEPHKNVHNRLPMPKPVEIVGPPAGPMPPATLSFSGMSFADTYCQGGRCGGGHPPDPTGAVGSNHYIQAINTAFAIYDKVSGNRLAAFTEASLWSGVGSTACATSPTGDPIVVYDQVFDRWILSNFAFTSPDVGPFYECFAVSKSSDPVSGGWWFYAVQLDQGQVPANTLDDYPKLAVWNDGCLYLGANGFTNSSYSGQIFFSINRSQMYSGVTANDSLGFLAGSANFALFPATMMGNGASLPSPSTAAYYVQESETDYAFNVRTWSADACDTGGHISAAVVVPQDSYDVPDDYIVPQPPPGQNNPVDSLGDRLMQWVQYRKIGSTESLWVNHTTYSTGQNTSPQWGQIDVTGGTIHTNIVQQQIYQRDTTLYRWMGSLAIDNVGDMALCYSTSNGTAPNYPSIQCSGRLATDPPNQLPQGETEYIAGEGSSLVTQRWGDYSSTTVDPSDDCTFWYTNMYFSSQTNGSNGNYQTQIFAFKFPNCTGGSGQFTLSVTDVGNGTVTSNDGHINCGTTCSYNYDNGAQVTLTATPASGWTFAGWSGACSGTGSCQLTMTQNLSVTATFNQGQSYRLSVGIVGTGNVTSTDGFINCPGNCTHQYPPNTHVTLNATPASGWTFAGWGGACTGTGSCQLTMTQDLSTTATFTSPSSRYQFVASPPCRLVDTRQSSPIQGGTSRDFAVPQLGGCNIPANAAAYSLNVTVVPHGPLGYLTIWPTGQQQPFVSTMNSVDGRTKANAAIVPAGNSGAVSVYVTDTTDVILDIDGYFATANQNSYQFYPVTPCRVLDTRDSHQPQGLGPPSLSDMGTRDLPVLTSPCLQGISNPHAYSFNVTVVPVNGRPLNYLTVWPSDQNQPYVSTLNNPTATVVANGAIVPAAVSNGNITVFAYNSTDVIMDINGYFAAPGQGYSFYPAAPCRVLDTRDNNGQPFSGERTVNVVASACAPPSSAKAYVFNATVVPSGFLDYLTLYPDGQSRPDASTLNAYDGYITSNLAIIPTTNGSIDSYASQLTQLILDISGYFAP